MESHGSATFGEALRLAIQQAGFTQARLASKLGIDPGQVSRWATGNTVPHVDSVTRIGEILGTDLSEAFSSSMPAYELYVSAPITGVGEKAVGAHRDDVGRVVSSLDRHVNSVHWPGEHITGTADLMAADIATERNMKVMVHCSAFLYLQFSEVVKPSGALVELGIALGRRIKTTIIMKSGLSQPYMLQGFAAVAASLSFLPQARIYLVEDVDAACTLVQRNGRELLGLRIDSSETSG